MYKKLLLIIALGTIFKNNNMKTDNHDYLIITRTAQKIFPLYKDAKGNKEKMSIYQDFLNACMNKDHQLNLVSKKELKGLELLNEKTQTLNDIEVLAQEQNIEEFLRVLELIEGGFINKSDESNSCFFQ